MIIPSNIIQKKYTSGGEFVSKQTNIVYKGYYYILNNTYYAGKEYAPNSPEIIKISQYNKLLNNQETAIYSAITGLTSDQLKEPTDLISTYDEKELTRYFYKKVTDVNPIIIKETNKETYDRLKNNPSYQTTFFNNIKKLDEAEKEMPGLKLFLRG